MQRIKYFIGYQNIEIIRDRIAAVLADEFENQFIEFYNTDCEHVDFYVERSTPIDKAEMYIVNVSVDNATYDNKHYGQVDGIFIYNIDVYTNSKSIGDDEGDMLSAFKAQRITGIIRAILEDPIYMTLGYTFPFIEKTMVEGFKPLVIKTAGESDAINTVVNRMQLLVKAVEGVTFPEGLPLHQNNTAITLGLTPNGYKITFNA